jgi:hypothetical protein
MRTFCCLLLLSASLYAQDGVTRVALINSNIPSGATVRGFSEPNVLDANSSAEQRGYNRSEVAAGSAIYQINGDLYLDGVHYTTLAAALAALPSGGTVRITAGTYTISSSVIAISNIDIECSPNGKTILKASASLNAPMVSATSVSRVRIAGCVFDGNRSGNSNKFGGVTLSNATNNEIVNNHFQNFTGGRIVYLASGSNFNTIQDNEIDHYGQALPAPMNGQECIALAPSASLGVQDNDVIHNFCHDGNGGIGLYNSLPAASVTTNTSRNRILYNKVQGMVNDAFLIYSDPTANPVGSLVHGNLFEANIARCNGWPPNGTGWDSTNCPAGFLQSGASAGQGVGFDLNSNQSDQNQFIGNRAEYNFYEGGDDTPQVVGNANTSNGALGGCASNCVEWKSGGPFQTKWKANQGINIGGTFYLIASVQSSTVLTLTTAPGTQTNTQFDGFTNSRSIWKGNYFSYNGNGAPTGGQGAGLAIQGGYVVSDGNISVGNAYAGFYDQAPIYVTHTGDHSLFNCRIAACNEFNVQAALRPMYMGVVSDSANTNNALFWSSGTNGGFAAATALCNATNCGVAAIQDQGTNDDASDGKVRGASNTSGATHAMCFAAGGGTDCVNGSGNGYVELPAVGTSGSPAILAVQSSFSGTKVAGACTFTIANGIITNVTGC